MSETSEACAQRHLAETRRNETYWSGTDREGKQCWVREDQRLARS